MEGAEQRAMKVTPGSLLSSAFVGKIRLRAFARGVVRNGLGRREPGGTHAWMASVTDPIWLTLSSRQLQAFSSTARSIRFGLVTVRSSPTIWIPTLAVNFDQAAQSSWSKGSSMETTAGRAVRALLTLPGALHQVGTTPFGSLKCLDPLANRTSSSLLPAKISLP